MGVGDKILASDIVALRNDIIEEVKRRRYYGSLTTKHGYDDGANLDVETKFKESSLKGSTISWSTQGKYLHEQLIKINEYGNMTNANAAQGKLIYYDMVNALKEFKKD